MSELGKTVTLGRGVVLAVLMGFGYLVYLKRETGLRFALHTKFQVLTE